MDSASFLPFRPPASPPLFKREREAEEWVVVFSVYRKENMAIDVVEVKRRLNALLNDVNLVNEYIRQFGPSIDIKNIKAVSLINMPISTNKPIINNFKIFFAFVLKSKAVKPNIENNSLWVEATHPTDSTFIG